MPRFCSASTPSGMSPSPHDLSIGGTAPSTTNTLKPRLRAAMAVARPAGPPPTQNTSHHLFRSLSMRFFQSNEVAVDKFRQITIEGLTLELARRANYHSNKM